jgi:cell wall-associated NlpC family hydrolase
VKRRTLILGSAATLIGYGWTQDSSAATPATRTAAAEAIAWAAAQHGKPYQWGGTGPAAFDCSGLVMEAYAHAGIAIPRTAAGQWAAGPRVTSPQPGDLVFFPGADGTWDHPGHVGLVTGTNTMIQAYAPGIPVGTYPYGVPSALSGTGPGTVIGWTRPWAAT